MNFCPNCYASLATGISSCPCCGASIGIGVVQKPRPPYALPVGTLIGGKYRVGDVKEGGFALTYKGSAEGKIFAIKEMWLEKSTRAPDGKTVIPPFNLSPAEYKSCVERFKLEYETLRKLSHKHIVEEIDYFEENNTAYIVEEFIDGFNLDEYLRSTPRNSLPLNEAMKLLEKIADALRYIHKNNVLHRDLKPNNIMLRRGSLEPVLIDFGAAREFIRGVTKSATIIFTPGYAPPEQLSGSARYDERSDIYSLGATLYRILTGNEPIDDLSEKEKNMQFLPLNVRKVIMASLDPDPNNRPKDVDVFLAGLTVAVTQPLLQSEIAEVFAYTSVDNTPLRDKVIDSLVNWLKNSRNTIDIDKNLIVSSVENWPIYKIDMKILVEERELNEKRKPERVRPIPTPTVTKSNIDVWGYTVSLSEKFEDSGTAYDVDQSKYYDRCSRCGTRGLETCPECGGRRLIPCWRCDEKGKLECSRCGGRGEISCNACGGWFTPKGYIEEDCKPCGGLGYNYIKVQKQSWSGEYVWEEERMDCQMCGGKGKIEKPCPECRGSGMIGCDECARSGWVQCHECGGIGTIRCEECDATGEITCRDCNGEGYFLIYLVINANRYLKNYEAITYAHPAKYDQLDITNFISSSPPHTTIIKREADSIDMSIFNQLKFQEVLDELQRLHLRKETDKMALKLYRTGGKMVIKEGLTINRYDVYQVKYEFKGKKYISFVLSNWAIHSLSNPVEVLWNEYIGELKLTLKIYNYKELHRVLQKAINDFKPRKNELMDILNVHLLELLKEFKLEEIKLFVPLCFPFFGNDVFINEIKEEVKTRSKNNEFENAYKLAQLASNLYPTYPNLYDELFQMVEYYVNLENLKNAISKFDKTKIEECVKKLIENKYADKSEFKMFYKTTVKDYKDRWKIGKMMFLYLTLDKCVKRMKKEIFGKKPATIEKGKLLTFGIDLLKYIRSAIRAAYSRYILLPCCIIWIPTSIAGFSKFGNPYINVFLLETLFLLGSLAVFHIFFHMLIKLAKFVPTMPVLLHVLLYVTLCIRFSTHDSFIKLLFYSSILPLFFRLVSLLSASLPK